MVIEPKETKTMRKKRVSNVKCWIQSFQMNCCKLESEGSGKYDTRNYSIKMKLYIIFFQYFAVLNRDKLFNWEVGN